MKILTLITTMFLMLSAQAEIAPGNYEIEKIQCHISKYVMKLGGTYATYKIKLNVSESVMTMTVDAKTIRGVFDGLMDCTQTNQGSFVYTQENKYEGEMKYKDVECRNGEIPWAYFIRRKKFGTEAYGEFNYSTDGNKLVIYNENTINKYKCDGEGDYPVYYYKKIN